MLNVPDTVKALFKQDGVRKNFRVHFPSGEMPDITNDNIVQESVRFTESLCSQDVLKFGLAEASVIEFETVGIGNMYGMTIECGIEIDLSSLSAAECADIEDGSWDGVYVAAGDSDIGYAFFRVPYGVFRVESCPRDHQTMTHRKVQAYSLSLSNQAMNPFESAKLKLFYKRKEYWPNLYQLMISNLCYSSEQALFDAGYTAEALPIATSDSTFPDGFTFIFGNVFKNASGGNSRVIYTRIYFGGAYTSKAATENIGYKFLLSCHLNPQYLYSIDLNGVDYSAIYSAIGEGIRENAAAIGIDLEQSGFSSYAEVGKACGVGNGFGINRQWLLPLVIFPVNFGGDVSDRLIQFIEILKTTYAIYPHYSTGVPSFYYPDTLFPVSFEISFTPSGGSKTIIKAMDIPQPIVKKYTKQDMPTTNMIIGSTLESSIITTDQQSTYKGYSFVNSYSASKITNGNLELNASFAKVGRDGAITIMHLSNDDIVPVLPHEYANFWWDEYDVLPIGSVQYRPTESDDVVYQFGDGQSIYDMSDNDAITKLRFTGSDRVQSINDMIDANFAPYLAPIAFTPIDLTMKGLPYLEAGDYLAVTAEDGTIANSFAMRQEISGVQVLEATIESTSGQIIDSQEGAT